MAGGGSVQSMITILKNNRNLLNRNRGFLRNKKYLFKESGGEVEFKKLSKIELEKLKVKIREKAKNEEKKSTILFFCVLIPILMLLFFIVNPSAKNEKEQIKISKELYIKENSDQFNYLLKSGDEWIQKEKYYNAIFQYKLALKVFPDNKKAIKKLLNAYTIRCLREAIGCDKKKEFLEKRKTNF